ncbi:Aldo/keto reductase [Thelephora ganbajun]|uniref:Aldo/keto reductase n=1 Tax=Thelephora ganbajun TaxID=370292 RepID=A0ACB6ZH54_THEGA|nr:Aldo/keto reductase [Thelephora ganbajun]
MRLIGDGEVQLESMTQLLGSWYPRGRYGSKGQDGFKKTGKRNDILLATKFGLAHDHGSGRLVKVDPKYVYEVFNKPLSRLGVDFIGLHYLHQSIPTPLSRLIEHTRDESIGLLKTARELGVKIIKYSPLGRGLIASRYISQSQSPDDFEDGDSCKYIPGYSKENPPPDILKLTDDLKEISKKYGTTAGQVALAWVLAQGEGAIPIPGTTRLANLKENVEVGKVELSPEDVQAVREVVDNANTAQSGRYPEAYVKSLFADAALP